MRHRRRTLPLALGLVSFSVLLYEILLTRIFSVVLLYHFAYVAVSLALLGFSTGALLVYYRPSLHAPGRIQRTVVVYGAASGLSIVACALILINFQPEGVSVYADMNLPTFGYLLMTYAVATVPFILAGVCISALLAAGRDAIGRFYAYDLSGAALGAVAVIPVSEILGAPNGLLVAALAGTASGWVLLGAQGPALKIVSIGAAAVVLATGMASLEHPLLTLRFTKGTLERNVLYEEWNSYSRVTAEASRGRVKLRIDSGAATVIHPASAHPVLARGINTPAMQLRTGGDILIVGPGGGMDVAAAVELGFGSITGVELNPIVVRLATGKYRHLSGKLYDRENVRIVTDEGRSFLNRTETRFDVLTLTLIDTWAASAAGAFTLAENNLYTVEAFSEYIAHLKDDGILSITRWYFPDRPHETLRLLSLAYAALGASGVSDPERHCVVIAEGRKMGARATFLLKKNPFDRAELEVLSRMVAKASWSIVYGLGDEGDSAFLELSKASDPQAFYAAYEYDVSPPTDDRPFFFYVVRPGRLWEGLEHFRIPNITNIGLLLLMGSVVASALFVAILIGLPLIVQPTGRRLLLGRGVAPMLGYFACLGSGFMLVELALMQRFILFLGHPAQALTAVLFVLLMTGGIGSFYCGRLSASTVAARLPLWLSLVVAMGFVYTWGLPALFQWAIGFPKAVRVGLTVACLAPLGLLLGTCFPAGIRLLGERAEKLLAWVWAVNGATSVLGSAAGMLIAMNWGFSRALLAGFGLYAVALACSRGFRGAAN